MKIELIKEKKSNGEIRYCTEIDGEYVSSSVTTDREIAIKEYNKILKNKAVEKREILLSTEL